MNRRGNWMLSLKGHQLWPMDLRPEDLDIEEIAHALSNICRFGGHCRTFYSVAQHSVFVAECVSTPNKRTALLHDATEAYVGDVVRPLKVNLVGYEEIESAAWQAVSSAFRLPEHLPEEVELADARVLLAEKRDLLNNRNDHVWDFPQCRFPDASPFPARPISPLLPTEARRLFLDNWATLAYDL
jgi:uncharacterized protein